MITLFFIQLIVFTLSSLSTAASVNPLNGQHLRVMTSEYPMALVTKRNATGHIIYADGAQTQMLEALSRMLNFSYSYLPIDSPFFEDSPQTKGIGYYLIHDVADFSLSSFVATPSRFQKVDFPANWWYGPFSTLLPYPKEETLDFAAGLKPLSFKVWIMVAIAAFAIILYLKLLLKSDKLLRHQIQGLIYQQQNVILYILGNLASQGQHFFPKRLAARLAAGAWCCGCFFLVQIYCCNLTSHLTSRNEKPIINSFFDIANASGAVSLAINKGFALDVILKNTESEHVKQFVGSLKEEDRLIRCNATSDCLNYVKNGNSVYSAPLVMLKAIVDADIKSDPVHPCQYTITKEEFWSSAAYTLLRKNSPYTESITKGILRLRETGLFTEWNNWYSPSPSKCMDVNKRVEKTKLSMKHLSSAFVILCSGCLISVAVFFLEKIRAWCRW